MNKMTQLLVTACLCMAVMGCKKDFLTLAPLSNPNSENFYKTRADFDLAVNAAYATLSSVYAVEGPVSYVSEQMGDNATLYTIAGGVLSEKWAFKDYTVNASNSMVYSFWQNLYKSVFTINVILTRMDEVELDPAYEESVKAQMLFLRSLYYYYIVQMWGDVPLVTKPVTAAESYGILRSPKADVYNMMVTDLRFSISKLPAGSKVLIRGDASKGAAQTLLAKVYLAMGDKAAAAQVLTDIVNSNEYDLLPSYASLWVVSNKNTRESVFELQRLGGSSTTPYSPYYSGFFPNVSITFSGTGMNQVTDDLWNEYEAGDVRKNLSIDTGYLNGSGSFVRQKFPKKWTDVNAPIVGSTKLSNNNFMIFRYADVLLMLSEATGDMSHLNKVRARVSLPLYGSADYPSKYATPDLAIEHERRVELAMEFHRWFDLKRTGRAVPVLSAKGKPVTEEKLTLPIPEIVRQQNPEITQNNGY